MYYHDNHWISICGTIFLDALINNFEKPACYCVTTTYSINASCNHARFFALNKHLLLWLRFPNSPSPVGAASRIAICWWRMITAACATRSSTAAGVEREEDDFTAPPTPLQHSDPIAAEELTLL